MPGLGYVVAVVDDNESLYDRANHEAYTCEECVISDCT
jgi:hypothetical protein